MKEKIKCPNCGEEIDVEEALSSKFEEHLKKPICRKKAWI